jgi:hypothetical protein
MPQLGIVEAVGRFLAVACDEGHRGAIVAQGHSGGHLVGMDVESLGDTGFYGRRHEVPKWQKGEAGWGKAPSPTRFDTLMPALADSTPSMASRD